MNISQQTLFAGNRIQRLNGFQYGSFANLVTLELRGNHLETTDGINLPHLQQLYLVHKVSWFGY